MRESVIFAHGLWLPGDETILLRNRLRNAGYSAHLFRFPTVRGSLTHNTQQLARFAEGIGGDKLHFVGYSLGGIVTLIGTPPNIIIATFRADVTGEPFSMFDFAPVGVPIAAGILYPVFGLLLSPMIAAAAMSLSSVSVIGNALRLSSVRV